MFMAMAMDMDGGVQYIIGHHQARPTLEHWKTMIIALAMVMDVDGPNIIGQSLGTMR